ncbi:non-ATPase regulatory subunit 14 of 26S proteasome [Mitosporidium daphniae]|uniref:Non-ATPase regulatory subunit 14 of 26S proteasome n=1 Tax=Mitosporidium daphniae TaxID=1485682 RepID=A0A098VMI3_9MICR|nr:non-ATPase regulatory subunit 14 of 26S proteasome [Mitosporidium daphniae]KGG50180.1 non-ATPase regulatory subunit 14 of 26S proteasome [Mitosporidium daphniae]|eukprot:XP_013236607.1 non-ATPase regulatory subunit 14 of 26S proteasome [Mitosporidium daphniae]
MMDLESLLRGASSAPGVDIPMVDAAETIQISSLALIKVCIFSLSFKMLKHGRAGVPMEVMGLMLGDFVDDYTIRVVDVFAMPQSGTGVSVEAVDPVFQMKMLDMLKQTGRPEMVVGWYHSHPGFGCWLSGVDIGTQQRAVAVVIDPIQSVKGKVVIDAFRLIQPQTISMGQEPRQISSNIGQLQKPSIQKLLALSESYSKSIEEELTMTPEQLKLRHIGKKDPKRHLEELSDSILSSNLGEELLTHMNRKVLV